MNPKKIGQFIIIALVFVGGYYFYSLVFGAVTINKTALHSSSLETGLVGHWTFDGEDITATTATDVSGNGNDGTLNNGPQKVEGKIGQALDFDGSNDFVEVAAGVTNPELSIKGDVTIAAWVKPDSLNASAVIVRSGIGADATYIMTHNTSSEIKFQWYDGSWMSASSNTGVAPVGEWTYAVITREGSTISFYINGAFNTSAATATVPLSDSSFFHIGATTASSQRFDGKIDDVRVYNRALTADEISQLYDQTKGNVVNKTTAPATTLETGLVGHWTFDGPDVSGTTVLDKSGNGLSGTINNGASVLEGKIGQALDFDGVDDFVYRATDPLLTPSTFTISLWAKSDVVETSALFASAGGNGYNRGFNIMQQHVTGKASFRWGDGVNFDGIITGTDTNSTEWRHIVGTYDGITMSLYVNGRLEGSDNTVNFGYTSGGQYIGLSSGVANFDGKIDDVRLYNRALTADEISQLYDQTKGNVVNKTTAPATTLETGLVGHWTFDGPDMLSNVADVSGNGNNGFISGQTATTTVEGKIGQALLLDGVDDEVITTTNNGNGSTLATFSISVWFKTNIASGKKIIGLEQNQSGTGATAYDRQIYVDTDGKVRFYVYAPTGTYVLSTNATYADNEWHHAVGVATSDSEMTLYVDGVFQQSTSIGTPYSSYTASYWRIGGYKNNITAGASGYFPGAVDNIRIYNRALTASEVEQLYNMGE